MMCNLVGGYQCFGGNCCLHYWPWTVGNQVQDSVVSYHIRPCHIMLRCTNIYILCNFNFMIWDFFLEFYRPFILWIFQVFTFEYLEPYENGSCHQYTSCLHCLTDSLCGWCDLNQRCYSRHLNEMEVCTAGTDI